MGVQSFLFLVPPLFLAGEGGPEGGGGRPEFPDAVPLRVPRVGSAVSQPLPFVTGDLGPLVTLSGQRFYNPLSCLCARCGRLAFGEQDVESGPAVPVPQPVARRQSERHAQ